MTGNDEIRQGKQHNGEYWLMCKKCGDSYQMSKRDYMMYRDVRWRCKACIYMWL